MSPGSVAFYTLGCKLNFAETSTLARQFEERGFARREFYQPADVYLINTCSVTDHADRKCRKVVAQALRQNPNAYVIIVGCYAQLKPEAIANIPGVSAVLGAAEKFRLFEIVSDFSTGNATLISQSPIADVNSFMPSYSLEERTRAFLKVQDGCDYKCSFCTIPLARGASRSERPDAVIATARQLTASGTREIVISGINLGDFGHGLAEETDLYRLLCSLEDSPGIAPRLRLSSIEPNLLTDSIIELVARSTANGGRLMPHFHIPLQSGSNKILKLMRRRYKAELYAERVIAIKTLMPEACIGVDVITGFPGESEADFLETYTFLNALDISYLHVFPYSERDHTLAATLPGRLPNRVRDERCQALRQLSLQKRRYFYRQHVGQVRSVLFEETAHVATNGQASMQGFTDNYIKVSAMYDPLCIGELVDVRLAELGEGELVIAETVDRIPA